MTSPPSSDDRTAEVLRLAYVDGLGVRAIAKRLSMSRKTVRRLLGRKLPPPRGRPIHGLPSSIRTCPSSTSSSTETPGDARAGGARAAAAARLQGRRHHPARPAARLRPGRGARRSSRCDSRRAQAVQVDWADFGFALPGCPRRVSAFVAGALLLALPLPGVHAQPVDGRLPALHGAGLAFFGGTTAPTSSTT